MRRTAVAFLAGASLVLALRAVPREEGKSPPPPPAPPTAVERSRGNPAAEPEAVATLPATVIRVIDGDTAEVRLPQGGSERVRFIGVNAPELSHPELGIRAQPYGQEAAAYSRAALAGRTVYLELDTQERDRYRRLLAYVWLERPARGGEAEVRARMFNARLLLDGYAQLMTVPPNVRYADLFARLQAEARQAGRGLWGASPGGEAGSAAAGTGKPARENVPAGNAAARAGCDPSYPDACIPPPPPDLDCRDIPHRRFRVLPPDPHHFDSDGDGVGCER